MNKDVLELLKKVVVLLDNGVGPYSLEYVLSKMGCEYNNGINFEFYYFIKRLEMFYDEEFNSDDLKVSRHDFDKVNK